jgi:hypothetical protein
LVPAIRYIFLGCGYASCLKRIPLLSGLKAGLVGTKLFYFFSKTQNIMPTRQPYAQLIGLFATAQNTPKHKATIPASHIFL